MLAADGDQSKWIPATGYDSMPIRVEQYLRARRALMLHKFEERMGLVLRIKTVEYNIAPTLLEQNHPFTELYALAALVTLVGRGRHALHTVYNGSYRGGPHDPTGHCHSCCSTTGEPGRTNALQGGNNAACGHAPRRQWPRQPSSPRQYSLQ
ncbi:hypothetical protein CYMTET_29807 [Cymbomonas tetramitiformis]|uniref:Uncharacterized protein n=1 Tax=Cymbomonas tetramitiformis TaxID=36881 RepID=A0AAE0FKB3_9CHLO|nr:hypothetical protein CYMTET_29807 [Cymbomonas tetramitiformis]